jgi:ribonuclease HII
MSFLLNLAYKLRISLCHISDDKKGGLDIMLLQYFQYFRRHQGRWAIIKGDLLSYSISCASIIAKVARDDYMIQLARQYPLYGFEVHKGYPTKKHIEALQKYGVLDIHRRTYQPVASLLK